MVKLKTQVCPICKRYSAIFKFTAPDFDTQTQFYTLYQCRNCNFAFVFPHPAKKEISSYYNKKYYGSANKKFTAFPEYITKFYNFLRGNYINRIISKNICMKEVARPKRILDIGCGRGNLLKTLLKYKYECYGLERAELDSNIDTKINFLKKDLFEVDFKEQFFNCVILWHVYEHLYESPNKVLNKIKEILMDEGILVLSVPNFTSFQSYIFRENWFHLDLPRHKYHFSSRSLELLLSNFNYKIRRKTTFSFEQSVFGFIQSFFNKFLPFKPLNKFYSLLRLQDKNKQQYLQLLLFIFCSLLIIPFAIIEYIISGSFNKGAVITIYAEKLSKNDIKQ